MKINVQHKSLVDNHGMWLDISDGWDYLLTRHPPPWRHLRISTSRNTFSLSHSVSSSSKLTLTIHTYDITKMSDPLPVSNIGPYFAWPTRTGMFISHRVSFGERSCSSPVTDLYRLGISHHGQMPFVHRRHSVSAFHQCDQK